MSRIQTPPTVDTAPAGSQEMLELVKKKLGVVPNLFRMLSVNPVVLEAHLGLSGALGKGKLAPQTRERIALAVAEQNGCNYCLSAHTYLAKNLAKLDDAEILANRSGTSSDPRADAAVRFAVKAVRARGHLSSDDVELIKRAGYGDDEILEIIFHVALNTWTNYVNEIAQTVIDFPPVKPI